MPPRARALALTSNPGNTLSRGRWALLAALALGASIAVAHGQDVVVPKKGTSGPQTAVPAPLPPGTGADTPGGSARNGVISPPPVTTDSAINRSAPSTGGMPIIKPPGTAGGNQRVIPK